MKEAGGEERVDNIIWRVVKCGGTCPLREPGVMPSRRGEGPGRKWMEGLGEGGLPGLQGAGWQGCCKGEVWGGELSCVGRDRRQEGGAGTL